MIQEDERQKLVRNKEQLELILIELKTQIRKLNEGNNTFYYIYHHVEKTGCRKKCMQLGGNGVLTLDQNVAATSSTTGSLVCTGGAGIAGSIYTGSGIFLPTSGGSASSLNYYETGTTSMTFSGPWTADQTGNVKFTRVGNMVTLTIDSVASTASSPSLDVLGNSSPYFLFIFSFSFEFFILFLLFFFFPFFFF